MRHIIPKITGRGVTFEILWRTPFGIMGRPARSRHWPHKVPPVVRVVSRPRVRHLPTKGLRRIIPKVTAITPPSGGGPAGRGDRPGGTSTQFRRHPIRHDDARAPASDRGGSPRL